MRSILLAALLASFSLALAAAAPAQCGTGSLTTTFADNNGQSGNMYDIEPATDLTIECFDVNSRATVGSTASLDFWYKSGTAVGFEQNSAAWTFLGTFSFVANGRGSASNVDVSGNGVTFQAAQTYGIYLDAGASGGLAYTNGGPITYSNADLDLTTHSGNASSFGSVFFPRQWNGTVYYTAGPGTFTLSVSGLTAGGTATVSTSNGTASGAVGVAYSLTGGGPSSANAGPCGAVTVDLSAPVQVLGIFTADGSGNMSTSAGVPAGTTGVSVWLQALDVASCTLSNGLAEVIG